MGLKLLPLNNTNMRKQELKKKSQGRKKEEIGTDKTESRKKKSGMSYLNLLRKH